MLEQPSQAGRIAFRVSGSTDGVESEANAEEPSDRPMRDAMAEEVEQDPGGDHGDDGGRFRVGGSRLGESQKGGGDACDLQSISR